MKTVNEMKLCVPSKSCNEAFARCVVSAFVMSLDPTVNELSDLKTAVSEAVTNCIVHGYRHQSGTIYINGKITSENKVIITIRDKGCGISDIKKAMEPCLLQTIFRQRNRVRRTFCIGVSRTRKGD